MTPAKKYKAIVVGSSAGGLNALKNPVAESGQGILKFR